MRVWITKVFSFNLNTRTRVKLHANACNYKISKFYMQLITHTVHSLCTHCPRTGHEYYTQTTRILRACRCCNPFDRYCSNGPYSYSQFQPGEMMGDKSVETIGSKIRFLIVLDTFPPPLPPKEGWLFLRLHRPQRPHNIELWAGGVSDKEC